MKQRHEKQLALLEEPFHGYSINWLKKTIDTFVTPAIVSSMAHKAGTKKLGYLECSMRRLLAPTLELLDKTATCTEIAFKVQCSPGGRSAFDLSSAYAHTVADSLRRNE